MRLFTAIDLAPDTLAAVVSEQKKILSSIDGAGSLRLVKPEHIHLTLVFIGETAEATAAAIVDAMREPFPVAPFVLAFGGAGVFPPHGAPRVLWLGVVSGAGGAIDLNARVTDRMARFGVEREARPYRPHLTLARYREGRKAKRPRLPESTGDIPPTRVEAVTLYQSRVSSAGPTYTALARAVLRPT